MYHTEKINQASIEKNLKQTGFSSQNLQIADYTPFEQDIIAVFLRYLNAPWIQLTNAFIAKKVGCSTRTVTSATTKFHKQGLITKHQPDNYRANHYTLHASPKLYISHRVIVDHKNKKVCSRFYPNKRSSLLLDSLFRNSYVAVLTREARNNRHVFFQKIKGKIVNSVQKQLILSHRSDPTIKDIIRKPQVMSEILTPNVEKLTQLLALDEREQFKLIAFDENALEHVLAEVEPIVNGNKPVRHTNRMEWLIGIGRAYCKNNNLVPDWSWYYSLCEILGIETKIDPKPFVIRPQPQQVKTHQKGIYVVWKSPKLPSLNKQIEAKKLSIAGFEKQIENPEQFWEPGTFLFSVNITVAKSFLAKARQELEDLEAQKNGEDSSEKQSISYRYNSDSMATCSA